MYIFCISLCPYLQYNNVKDMYLKFEWANDILLIKTYKISLSL